MRPSPEGGGHVWDVGRVVRLADGEVKDEHRVLLRRPDDHGGVELVRQEVSYLVSGDGHRNDHGNFLR